VRKSQIFVMGGHEGGIVSFGKDFEEAFAVLVCERNASSPCIENGFDKRILGRHEG